MMIKKVLLGALLVGACSAVPSRNFKQHGGPVRGKLRPDFKVVKSTVAIKNGKSDGKPVEFLPDPDAQMVGVYGEDDLEPSVRMPGEANSKSFDKASVDHGGKVDKSDKKGDHALVLPNQYDTDQTFLFWQIKKADNPMQTKKDKVQLSAKGTRQGRAKFVQNSRGSEYSLDVLRISELSLVGQPIQWQVSAPKGSLSETILAVSKDGAVISSSPAVSGVVSYTPTAPGHFSVQVSAVITRSDGVAVERTFDDALDVLKSNVAGITSVALDQQLEDGEHLAVLVTVALASSDTPGTKYLFSADLYGAGGAVSTLGGIAELTADKTIEFFVQPEPFDAPAATAPFQLKHLQVSSPDGLPLFFKDIMDASSTFQKIDKAGSGRRLLAAGTETKEERETRILQGRRPVREKLLNHPGASSLGHKKLLVHGYCSGYPAWRQPMERGEFGSNAIEFIDPGANNVVGDSDDGVATSRVHSDFAQRIKDWSDTQAFSCTIVAHSQGGAASLQMYNTLWTCLDHAPADRRLIQSVGTPYGGTSLAGILAEIGNAFGAGCGENPTLTYSGAASWVPTVAAWAKANVWYESSSVMDWSWSIDTCAVTDWLLSDPDDGITEMSSAQLSGGNNLGHRVGYCHTRSMTNPSQTGNMESIHGTYKYIGGPNTGFPGASWKTYGTGVLPPTSNRYGAVYDECELYDLDGCDYWYYESGSPALQLRSDNLHLLSDISARNREWATFM